MQKLYILACARLESIQNVKVRNLWIISSLVSVFLYQTFMSFREFLMRTFFTSFLMFLHAVFKACASLCSRAVSVETGFLIAYSCTISVQELPVPNHFINDFDLLNRLHHRRIVHHIRLPCTILLFCMPSDKTVLRENTSYFSLVIIFVMMWWKWREKKVQDISNDDNVCNTKVSDNYAGQGHEIISFFIAHSKAIHHSYVKLFWLNNISFYFIPSYFEHKESVNSNNVASDFTILGIRDQLLNHSTKHLSKFVAINLVDA